MACPQSIELDMVLNFLTILIIDHLPQAFQPHSSISQCPHHFSSPFLNLMSAVRHLLLLSTNSQQSIVQLSQLDILMTRMWFRFRTRKMMTTLQILKGPHHPVLSPVALDAARKSVFPPPIGRNQAGWTLEKPLVRIYAPHLATSPVLAAISTTKRVGRLQSAERLPCSSWNKGFP